MKRILYEDGNESLADVLRYRKNKRIAEFLGPFPDLGARHLSSVIKYNGVGRYYPKIGDFDLEELNARLAHASKVNCEDITLRTIVLCIYRNDRGRLVYNEHKAGQCPYVKDWIANDNYKVEDC